MMNRRLPVQLMDLCAPHEIEPLGYTFRIGDNNDIVIAKPQDGIKVDMESAIQLVIDQICSFNFGDIEFIPVKTKVLNLIWTIFIII